MSLVVEYIFLISFIYVGLFPNNPSKESKKNNKKLKFTMNHLFYTPVNLNCVQNEPFIFNIFYTRNFVLLPLICSKTSLVIN